MFEEATVFHTRLAACNKYAVMQRDGAAGETPITWLVYFKLSTALQMCPESCP